MSDASESSRRDVSTRSAKSSSNAAATVAVKTSTKSSTAVNRKQPKTIVNKVDNSKDKQRSTQTKNSATKKSPVVPAPLAHPEDEEIIAKMARSNTFSKEKSDNPLELLKIMN